MIVEILFVVFMALWVVTFFPGPHIAGYPWAHNVLAWICVMLLGVFVFVPGLR